MTYQTAVRGVARREASQMRGQAIKTPARLVILFGLLGGAIVFKKRRS